MNLTLKARLGSVIGFLSLISVGIGVLVLYGMTKANDGLKNVYENRTMAMERISQIDRLAARNQLALDEAVLNPTESEISKNGGLIEKNIAEITQIRTDYSRRCCTDAQPVG